MRRPLYGKALPRTAAISIAFIGIVSSAGAVPAQSTPLRTETVVHLRGTPSSTGQSLRRMPALTRLSSLGGDTITDTTGERFIRVRTTQGLEGFAAVAFLFPDSVAPGSFRPDTVLFLNSPRSRVDTAWEKHPLGKSILVRSTPPRKECGPRGDDSDPLTFLAKNRNDYPTRSHAVTLDAFLQLPFTQGKDQDDRSVPKDRVRWSADHHGAVNRFEGVALTVTGFLAAVKPQGSGNEKTNCGFSGGPNTDWHVALVPGHRDPESDAIVVEPTPRFLRRHPKWTVANLRDRTGTQRQQGDSVRITGFLFYDPDHANHLGRFRNNMWELHPVTRIEIFSGGAWVDLDDVGPPPPDPGVRHRTSELRQPGMLE